MAHQPMLKPDPTRYPRLVHTRVDGPEWLESDSRENAAEVNQASFERQEELASDLALDLRLHEILEQALVATGATGAVIALASGDEMVCRATSGDKAPMTGDCLNARTGLSGACVQSHEMQRCDDTLADPRVNPTACRDLEIRSVLVLPVLDGEKLWGIFEVFSSVTHAFSDTDVQALQALCRRISRTVHEAIQGASFPAVLQTVPSLLNPDPSAADVPAREILPTSDKTPARVRRHDYGTTLLTVAVIALAVLLGWMVGRAGWSMALNRAQTQFPGTPEKPDAGVGMVPDIVAAAPSAEVPDVSAKPVRPTPAPTVPLRPASKLKAEASEPGGLVVYEQGKVVFRMPPEKTSLSGSEHAATNRDAAPQADSSATSVAVSSPSGYLLERVEPQYPPEAKQQQIQGPVVLSALVGTDGSVRELKVISGNAQLVNAAADAVRQWRFQPHRQKGRPVEFETRITVNFALP